MAKVLHEAGADVNLSTIEDYDEFEFRCTPLSKAAESENVELVQLLLRNGARLNSSDKISPLFYLQEVRERYTLEQVNFINIIDDNQFREKCLLLIMAKNSLSLPLDIIGLIVKTTRASMEFWKEGVAL